MSVFRRAVGAAEVTHPFSNLLKKEHVLEKYVPKNKWATQHLDFAELVAHSKQRGLVFPSSEHYNGIKGNYDYGALGTSLKRNIETAWLDYFVKGDGKMALIDSAIVQHPKTWEVAGHVENFTDPSVTCTNCGTLHRVDNYIESKGGRITENYRENLPAWQEEIKSLLAKYKFKCTCGKCVFSEPSMLSMLMETTWGSTRSYLRPETAQGIFLNYETVLRSERQRLPFGIAQIGKAFRNEISPRDFIYRMREFEQIELELFCDDKESDDLYHATVQKCVQFLQDHGIPENMVRLHSYEGTELAHYARATTDIEFQFPFGWGELWGIAHRGDYDLSKHKIGETTYKTAEDDPLKGMEGLDRNYPHTFFPTVVEPSVGLDRLFFAFLHSAVRKEYINVEQGGKIETGANNRKVMLVHPKLAPVKIAVFPLVQSNEHVGALARDLEQALGVHTTTVLDTKGSIGKRYARQDEIGTPWCICVDEDTLSKGTVTIRNRDTRDQMVMPLEQVLNTVKTGKYLPF